MPTQLEAKPIKTLVEFTTFVEGQEGSRWYRGSGDSEEYKLVPTLFRHPRLTDPDKLLVYEADIIKRFKQRSMPYLNRPLRDDGNWDLLFLMQHSGVPTRLLDWTENPYIGLYFALTAAKYDKTPKGARYRKDAAVWVLDPIKWNTKALEGYSDPPTTLTPEDDVVRNGYKPGEGATGGSSRRSDPVAIYGSYNSARIVAQRGVFTMFGTSTQPMEEIYEQKNFPQDCLLKLNIPRDAIENLLEKLIGVGITDSVVFPELEGLAREIKRQFKYWV